MPLYSRGHLGDKSQSDCGINISTKAVSGMQTFTYLEAYRRCSVLPLDLFHHNYVPIGCFPFPL